MRFAGSIALFVVILALAFYSYFGHASSVVVGKLEVENLFVAIGIPFNENMQAEVAGYHDIFAKHGFMALYRECYTRAFDSHRFDFDRQFAAASTLLVISRYELDSDALRASAQRLFINFCRLSLVDKISAVQINKLVEDYKLFSDNPEAIKLWDEYLQSVWLKEVRQRIRRYGTLDESDKEFIKLREPFSTGAADLINRLGENRD